jgi:hypothetical protein
MISQALGEVGGELVGKGISKAKPVVNRLLAKLPKVEFVPTRNSPLFSFKKTTK